MPTVKVQPSGEGLCRSCEHAHIVTFATEEGRGMILAIVGSRELAGNAEAKAFIEDVLDRYKPDQAVSGGAVGIDTMAKQAAERRGIPVDEKLPKENNWERGFKPRNMEIAHACDRLVCIRAKSSATYGSGWTLEYTNSIGKPTEGFVV